MSSNRSQPGKTHSSADKLTEKGIVGSHEFYRTFFDTVPIGVTVFDADDNIIDCNEIMLSMFDVSKAYYLANFFKFSPEYQPDGSNSREKSYEYTKRALGGETVQIEWMHCSKNGDTIPCEVTMRRAKSGDGYICLAFVYDLRHIRKMEQALAEAEEQTRLMLDSGPLCCQLWDRDCRIIDCNEAAVNLYGFKNKQEYIDRWLRECSPEYQPDGLRSDEKGLSLVRKAFKDGRCVFEWMQQMTDGTPFPAEVTLVRVRYKDDYVVAGYTRDLRRYVQMMREIEEYTNLLQLLNKMSETLLQSRLDEFEVSLHWCANTLGTNMKINRVRVWENHVKKGRLFCTQLFEWSEGAELQHGNEYTVDVPYDKAVPGWEEILSQGKCINEIVRDMSPAAQAYLKPQGILSLLVVPIFLQNRFWGVAGYDNCKIEQRFSEKEETILRSASQLIASVLSRNEVAEKAYYDSLTGIYNRRYLDENLNGMIQSLSRSGGVLSLMMIDIDHFKRYNDTYGHDAGDKCLKSVAKILSDCIARTDDFVVRYGGEEFVVVLPNTDGDGACLIAEKLLESVRSRKMVHRSSSVAGYVTISIGVTAGNAEYTQEGDEYIRRADEMLYNSKHEGRNRYSFAPLHY